MRYYSIITLCAALLASNVYANEVVGNVIADSQSATGKTVCPMQEQISINVNFNITAEGFAQAKAKFDERMKTVEDFAKKQNVKKFEVQSMNYNVNANNDNNGERSYQLNGSANYQMDNADSAFKLSEFLTKDKFQVSVSSNAYRNGDCGGSGSIRE